MRLSERLQHAGSARNDAENGQGPAATVDPSAPPTEPTSDPFGHLKNRAQHALFARLGSRLYDSSLSESQLISAVRQELEQLIQAEQAPLTQGERQRLVNEVAHDVLGYGPIQPYLQDETVTEVMVNGEQSIFIERAGRLHRTPARFVSEDHLRRVIEKIVSQVGRRIDESAPMVDARLPDGSRVNAIIPPLAVDGPTLTIRKFAKDPYQVDDLIGFGTMTQEMAVLLSACVEGHLNVLSSFIPRDERIVTIEDAVELQLHQDHVIRLESRPPNIEGRGQVTVRDLVRNALRMRPDRIIVGETRGGEALDMLQAMNTGHDGSLSTIHANTPRDALSRLETMVLMAGMDLPMRAIREQVASALDLIVHLTRLRDGSRRISHVTEVLGMEGEVITLTDLFLFDYSEGISTDGRFLGRQRSTGIRPRFLDRLTDHGIAVSPAIFGADPSEIMAAMRPDHMRRRL